MWEPGTQLRAGSWVMDMGNGISHRPLSTLGMIRPHAKVKALLDKLAHGFRCVCRQSLVKFPMPSANSRGSRFYLESNILTYAASLLVLGRF